MLYNESLGIDELVVAKSEDEKELKFWLQCLESEISSLRKSLEKSRRTLKLRLEGGKDFNWYERSANRLRLQRELKSRVAKRLFDVQKDTIYKRLNERLDAKSKHIVDIQKSLTEKNRLIAEVRTSYKPELKRKNIEVMYWKRKVQSIASTQEMASFYNELNLLLAKE